MTLEVFNHIKNNEETATFIADVIGPTICDTHVCTSCPLALPERLEMRGIKTSCACAHFIGDKVSPEAIEISKIIHAILGPIS